MFELRRGKRRHGLRPSGVPMPRCQVIPWESVYVCTNFRTCRSATLGTAGWVCWASWLDGVTLSVAQAEQVRARSPECRSSSKRCFAVVVHAIYMETDSDDDLPLFSRLAKRRQVAGTHARHTHTKSYIHATSTHARTPHEITHPPIHPPTHTRATHVRALTHSCTETHTDGAGGGG